MTEVRVGTAGWSLPRQHAAGFPAEGSHLARYASRFSAAEINSCFHRPHRPATYARWAATVPPGFLFSAKLPRAITHDRRLVDVADPLDRFLGEVEGLGAALGPLLVQLPPSLAFDAAVIDGFLGLLRQRVAGGIACEPRHASWFTDAADARLTAFEVARVAADPAIVPRAAEPGGWPGLVYRRLHGSPAVYRSAYAPAVLDALAVAVDRARTPCWCIFDNTTLGAATGDALALLDRLGISR